MYREKDKKKKQREFWSLKPKSIDWYVLNFFFTFLRLSTFRCSSIEDRLKNWKRKQQIEMIRKGKNGTQFNKQQVQYLLYIHTNIETRFRPKIKPKQLTLLSELLQDRGGGNSNEMNIFLKKLQSWRRKSTDL